MVRRVGQPHGIGRLLPERGDRAAVLGGLDDPELVRELSGWRIAATVTPAPEFTCWATIWLGSIR